MTNKNKSLDKVIDQIDRIAFNPHTRFAGTDYLLVKDLDIYKLRELLNKLNLALLNDGNPRKKI